MCTCIPFKYAVRYVAGLNQYPELLLAHLHSQIPCHSEYKRKKREESMVFVPWWGPVMYVMRQTVHHRFSCSEMEVLMYGILLSPSLLPWSILELTKLTEVLSTNFLTVRLVVLWLLHMTTRIYCVARCHLRLCKRGVRRDSCVLAAGMRAKLWMLGQSACCVY